MGENYVDVESNLLFTSYDSDINGCAVFDLKSELMLLEQDEFYSYNGVVCNAQATVQLGSENLTTLKNLSKNILEFKIMLYLCILKLAEYVLLLRKKKTDSKILSDTEL